MGEKSQGEPLGSPKFFALNFHALHERESLLSLSEEVGEKPVDKISSDHDEPRLKSIKRKQERQQKPELLRY